LKILEDKNLWKKCAKNGLKGVYKHYTWDGHVTNYLNNIHKVLSRKKYANIFKTNKNKLPTVDRLLITDIDNTLLGDKDSLQELVALISNNNYIGFGVASGRTVKSIINILKQWKVPIPDITISSVGAEIYYGKKLVREQKLG